MHSSWKLTSPPCPWHTQVAAGMEAQERAAQRARRERDAKRNATKREFHYASKSGRGGGVTIEEHSDGEDAQGGWLSVLHAVHACVCRVPVCPWLPGTPAVCLLTWALVRCERGRMEAL